MFHQAKRISLMVFCCCLVVCSGMSQGNKKKYTRADSLRGSLNAERVYNVLQYDISVAPDYTDKSIRGQNTITYLDSGLYFMQIDLQEPLAIDSVVKDNISLPFTREGNVYHVQVLDTNIKVKRCIGCPKKLTVYYQGHPRIAKTPPWDAGFVFSKDSLGRPWMSVTCEGQGASVWFPCKDYLGDEPDSGASLTITVADTLVAVSNGRLVRKSTPEKGLTSWTWRVVNPINNYNIIPYIGKYVNWQTRFNGQKGNLDCSYWVLDYNLKKAKKHFVEVDSMLSCFEYWLGPYPFYEDGYKLVESPYLGMEHQSAVAYGNHYRMGYLGRDLSGSGQGLKWDYIIVHESGHEWFGNNITCKDIADMWIHESFTSYTEILYTGFYFGNPAADDYSFGIQKQISNKEPIISTYGVNEEPEGIDHYSKGSTLIHMIRTIIHNDETFRKIMRGLNQHFYHQTVTSKEVEIYISETAGIDLTTVFNQYLRTTHIPALEYRFEDRNLYYRWANCLPDFTMPVHVDVNGERWLKATTQWQKMRIPKMDKPVLQIDRNFYVTKKYVTNHP